jgi:hypothetical protein
MATSHPRALARSHFRWLSRLTGTWQGTEPDRPRHYFLDHKKIESGPGIILKVLGGLSALSARITSRTSGVPSKGPPRMTAPLASRSFINRAWAGHSGWPSSESEGSQAGPRERITANIFIFGPDAHLRLYSGVTDLSSRIELRTWSS